MLHRSIKTLLSLNLFLLTLLVAGCSKYQFTVNEAVVYTPPTLFTAFTTADPRLKSCLDQAIKDSNATAPTDVKRLVCTNAGLTSLVGLEVFSEISELNIADNQLTDIAPVARLPQLKALAVNNNKLRQVPEVLLLANLTYLDLSNNSQLNCGDLKQLRQHYSGELKLPAQCQ